MKRWKILLFTGLAAVLALVAQVSAASACFLHFYQPDCPKSLNKY
ncbi:MAG: cyclic lactone autoinducer peptide [Peptococcaceae bacterium]|nr:cyclic lactone autoinducer peptide [Peptococcaceae bacterium]